jgi:hypothetical protein
MWLIKKILYKTERKNHFSSRWVDGRVEFNHVALLAQSGFIRFHMDKHRGSTIHVDGLTWNGHELLDKIRNEEKLDSAGIKTL